MRPVSSFSSNGMLMPSREIPGQCKSWHGIKGLATAKNAIDKRVRNLVEHRGRLLVPRRGPNHRPRFHLKADGAEGPHGPRHMERGGNKNPAFAGSGFWRFPAAFLLRPGTCDRSLGNRCCALAIVAPQTMSDTARNRAASPATYSIRLVSLQEPQHWRCDRDLAISNDFHALISGRKTAR
jgi:hypothetical protein